MEKNTLKALTFSRDKGPDCGFPAVDRARSGHPPRSAAVAGIFFRPGSPLRYPFFCKPDS
jgi:hypothetical protein